MRIQKNSSWNFDRNYSFKYIPGNVHVRNTCAFYSFFGIPVKKSNFLKLNLKVKINNHPHGRLTIILQ